MSFVDEFIQSLPKSFRIGAFRVKKAGNNIDSEYYKKKHQASKLSIVESNNELAAKNK